MLTKEEALLMVQKALEELGKGRPPDNPLVVCAGGKYGVIPTLAISELFLQLGKGRLNLLPGRFDAGHGRPNAARATVS